LHLVHSRSCAFTLADIAGPLRAKTAGPAGLSVPCPGGDVPPAAGDRPGR